MFLRYLLPVLIALFPLEVISKLLVVALRALARKTKNTLDDDLVLVLEKHFNIESEILKDELSRRD